ncbi:MAG: ferrous iron transport protein B [Candidatus Bathyarchaeota archaeon]|nr:ferrous iron transport protein B [Candidatus Bathyarchaeota archaeon]
MTVALAGNANVGKSVIFNELTGLHQHVGNWPGKTVERAEGTLTFLDHVVDVIDLPGIYSLSTYSIEELVSREYIAVEQPDVLVNVVDASVLERNIFFTLQLLELGPRMVVALNQVDVAESKGIRVDPEKLSELLGVPVVPMVAVKGVGVGSLMRAVIEAVEEEREAPPPIPYGSEVEKRLEALTEAVRGIDTPYTSRLVAIKLLEGDDQIRQSIYGAEPSVEELVSRLSGEIEDIHDHDTPSVIASERYNVANRIASGASTHLVPRTTFADRLDQKTSHPVLGYLFMFAVIAAVFYGIFSFGDYASGLLGVAFGALKAAYDARFGVGPFASFFWFGIVEGVVAGVTIALPYIVPFYVALSVLEDSGYLARIAFLMDSAMHRIGLHGKGFIPLMLGFGCNVPACLGCRIMETVRERLICAFVASLVPCAARSIVIMGLVAEHVGFEWAAALYLIDFALIFALGRVAFKVVPGEPMGLIMEMPTYRWPTVKVTFRRSWDRMENFVREAFPIMVAGNFVVHVSAMVGLLDVVQGLLKPVTVLWLGLPAATGVVLIFGVLRKELTLILLASMMGTSNFALVLSPVQMFVFAFVVMVYIPCISTIAVLVKEFGYLRAAAITASEISIAVVLGGVLLRFLMYLGIP